MRGSQQTSLFGVGAPRFDARLRGLRRQHLHGGSWLDHAEGWLQGHDTLFTWLADEADWQLQQRRMYERTVAVPRLLAGCPPGGAAAAVLRRMSLALSVHYGVALPSIRLAWYRDGADSVAMHADRIGSGRSETIVAIVSVGMPRRFVLRPRGGGRRGPTHHLGWGDLLVMGGRCQLDWLHGVPRAANAGPRISIMFRELEPPAAPRGTQPA